MTYSEDFTLPAELLEQVQEQGLDVLPELIWVIINAAMQAEREQHINAELYQHTEARSGYANGDDANPCRRYHLLDSASAGRPVLSASLGKRPAE